MRWQQGAVAVLLVHWLTGSVQAQSAAADQWRGVKVLPKLNAVVKVGNTVIEQRFRLPWVVQEVKDKWLWVGDSHKGWVQRSQVVTLDEAPQYYGDLITRGESRAWAYRLRAVAWYERGEWDSAIADFSEVLKQTPDAVTYGSRGSAWIQKKEYDKAIADFSQAIRFDPKDVSAYCNRAGAWAQKKDFDKAIADLNQASRIDPNDATACYAKACLYSLQGNRDQALENLAQAIRLGFGDIELLRTDPDLESIREDPRYQALINRLFR